MLFVADEVNRQGTQWILTLMMLICIKSTLLEVAERKPISREKSVIIL